ncbi:helix-turn-helix domain-containing protein [Anaerocolumna sp. AGMB13020]|uniref:helix-turn-helix domain-containing protein n=1 Tax=Anaerocolumna sp. AGMB13020 TaxID=3081750 RepID=UPI0029535FCE|nr:helix-turn-helix domain-containing protein [Anaerocolumna sp. AGMB13020]WOO35797.1 helix-turn-helix domain-containing protein [Anaerocolumna sp. AGMB13020]
MAMKKFKILNLICENCDLSSKEKLVAQYFVYKSNKSGECYPSVETISKHCGVSVRTVQRATKKLQEKNFITIDKRYYKGRQSSNQYTLNTDIEIKNKDYLTDESIQNDFELVSMSEILQDDITIYNPFEEETEATTPPISCINETIIETIQKPEELSMEVVNPSFTYNKELIKQKLIGYKKTLNNICIAIKFHNIYVIYTAAVSFNKILNVQFHYENIKYMLIFKVSKFKTLGFILHIQLYDFLCPF